jgi:replication factor A1
LINNFSTELCAYIGGINLNNIDELIKKISQHTGLSRAEIKMKIDQKKEELGFFVNDIAAAHIIAKDLNIPLGRPDLKKKSQITVKSLKKMEPGLSGISITGIILRVYHTIEFVKEGNKGILAPILLHDGTESIRLVLWGTMARKITDKNVERGSIIKIRQAYTKKGIDGSLELHLSDRGSLELDNEAKKDDFPDPEDEILDLDTLDEEMQDIDVKGTVHKLGRIVNFNRSDGSEGRVSNLFLKGKRVIRRMVFWDDRAEIPFDYTRGDELLIQAVNIKLDQEGKPELHATKTTSITKTGHQKLPDLEETKMVENEKKDVIIVDKKINDITTADVFISLIVRKGPVSETKSFTRQDGSTGLVKRAIIFDETGELTLVLWDDIISIFDSLGDNPFQIDKLRVKLSIYNTLEVHTLTETKFTRFDSSQISEDPPIQNISEVNANQGLTSIQGVIQNISDTREFRRSDGSAGRVASMIIQDTTGTCRIVAWDDKVDNLLSIKEKEMKHVKIFFGGVRQNNDGSIEVHLSPQSHIRPSSRIPPSLRNIEITEVVEAEKIRETEPDYQKIQLSELAEDEDGTIIEIIGKIIRVFQQTPYYWACPECRKKVEKTDEGWLCQNHELVEGIINLRISNLIDDGTGTIRTTFFGRSAEILTGMKSSDIKKLIENNLTDDEIFSIIQKEVEGKTISVQGRVQTQTREVQGETMLSQTLYVNRVSFPSPKVLAEELITELQEP